MYYKYYQRLWWKYHHCLLLLPIVKCNASIQLYNPNLCIKMSDKINNFYLLNFDSQNIEWVSSLGRHKLHSCWLFFSCLGLWQFYRCIELSWVNSKSVGKGNSYVNKKWTSHSVHICILGTYSRHRRFLVPYSRRSRWCRKKKCGKYVN